MVSTGSVYLDCKLDTANHCPFEESDVSWDSLDYTYPKGEDPYGVGKRHCEKWLRENGEVPYTIVRIPAVMGWDDPTGRMWWWVQRALDGGAVVIPSERRAVFRTLYSGDAANAFIRVIDSDAAENEVYHIAMQEIMTLERWTSLLWAAAGHESEIAYVSDEVIQRQEGLEDHIPPLARPVPLYLQSVSSRAGLRVLHHSGGGVGPDHRGLVSRPVSRGRITGLQSPHERAFTRRPMERFVQHVEVTILGV